MQYIMINVYELSLQCLLLTVRSSVVVGGVNSSNVRRVVALNECPYV